MTNDMTIEEMRDVTQTIEKLNSLRDRRFTSISATVVFDANGESLGRIKWEEYMKEYVFEPGDFPDPTDHTEYMLTDLRALAERLNEHDRPALNKIINAYYPEKNS